MLKCPYCGSTSQVKVEREPFISKTEEIPTLKEEFECGCGCHFSLEYRRDERGFWEFYTLFIDYIEP